MKLPSEFEARTLEWMGEETYRALEAALQTEPPVSITCQSYEVEWGSYRKIEVLWASAEVYLSQRPTFTFDPLFLLVAICTKACYLHVSKLLLLILPGCGDARFMCCSVANLLMCVQFFP